MMSGLLSCLMLIQAATRDNYSKIETGMSRVDVIKLLGKPPEAAVSDDESWSSAFTVLSYKLRHEGQLWKTGPFRIWVQFDAKGLVQGKMYDTVEWSKKFD